MINFKSGARTSLIMDKEDWRTLVTNTRNVKLGADSEIIVLSRNQTEMISRRVAEILSEKSKAATHDS